MKTYFIWLLRWSKHWIITLENCFVFRINTKEHKWVITWGNGKRNSTSLPQGCILDPYFSTFSLMISFFLLKLLHFVTIQMVILHFSGKNTIIIISWLRHDFAIISQWFYENHIVLNQHKSQFQLSILMSHLQIFLSTIL